MSLICCWSGWCMISFSSDGYQWEALALLLIGISVNQLCSMPKGAKTFGLPVTAIAYTYTLIFVSFLWTVYSVLVFVLLQMTEQLLDPRFMHIYIHDFMREIVGYCPIVCLCLQWVRLEKQVRHKHLSAGNFSWRLGFLLFCRAMRHALTQFPFSCHFSPYVTPTLWNNFQNVFLYGYGAIFNLLGILGTVILEGKHMTWKLTFLGNLLGYYTLCLSYSKLLCNMPSVLISIWVWLRR
jgi:hypothetical protein